MTDQSKYSFTKGQLGETKEFVELYRPCTNSYRSNPPPKKKQLHHAKSHPITDYLMEAASRSSTLNYLLLPKYSSISQDSLHLKEGIRAGI